MRTRIATRRETLPNGTVVERRKIIEAPDLEWRIQAEAVRRIRQLPGYGDEWGPGVTFTLAADFNAARRSPQEAVKAKATGIAAGEPDMRLYLNGGRLRLIEFKGARTPVSADQRRRHPLLSGLGFDVVIVRATTIEEGAAAAVALVRGWLGLPANDNIDRAQVAAFGAA